MQKLTLAQMQALAAERGGACLSETYVNTRTPLRWRCAAGHVWDAAPGHIRGGQWCPHCATQRQAQNAALGLDAMHRLAQRHGGRCLATSYANKNTPLAWECAKGHQWQAPAAHIRRGHWCPQCARHSSRQGVRLTLDALRHLAAGRNGRCLSDAYVNNHTPLTWQCAEGHQWQAIPSAIKRGGWCPVCAHAHTKPRAPGSLDLMQQIAAKRGGRCLSAVYVNSATPLEWECGQGHRWKARPNDVKNRNAWCPVCAGKAKLTLAAM